MSKDIIPVIDIAVPHGQDVRWLILLISRVHASSSESGYESDIHRCDTYLYEHIIQAVLLLLPTGFEELSPLRGDLDPRSNHADSLLETVTSMNTEFISPAFMGGGSMVNPIGGEALNFWRFNE